MDRGRDRRYDDHHAPYGAETYRAPERHARSPPRGESYRAPRSPPARRSPPREASYRARGDTRAAERPRSRSPRRRSRSPGFRRGDGDPGHGARTRTPPREVERVRSPIPARRYSGSPAPQKRARELSPRPGYRPRSPLPVRPGRYAEPEREDYERRDYPPPREEQFRYPRENNYRPQERSRTPPRPAAHVSGGGTPISSRRSSPRGHPDRMAVDNRPTASSRFEPYPDRRSPAHYRSRDPSPPRRQPSPVPVSPPREAMPRRERSPPMYERDGPRNEAPSHAWSNSQLASPSAGQRNGDGRPPPSGPRSSGYSSYPREPVARSPPAAPISMSAHNRPGSASTLAAPTRPRGGLTYDREPPRDGPYGVSPPSQQQPRGGRYWNSGPPGRHSNADPASVPTGPRSGYPSYEAPRVPFRGNSSSSSTYPRTQRFNNNHLASVPVVVEGGKKLPSVLEPAQERRLQQLEEERRKLLDAIEEKQRVKRQGLRDWEKAERESAREGLKSELAEGHLDRLSGETGMSGAAY